MYSTHIGTNIIHTYTLHGIQGETGLPLGQRQTFRRGVAGTLRNACSNPRKAVSSASKATRVLSPQYPLICVDGLLTCTARSGFTLYLIAMVLPHLKINLEPRAALLAYVTTPAGRRRTSLTPRDTTRDMQCARNLDPVWTHAEIACLTHPWNSCLSDIAVFYPDPPVSGAGRGEVRSLTETFCYYHSKFEIACAAPLTSYIPVCEVKEGSTISRLFLESESVGRHNLSNY